LVNFLREYMIKGGYEDKELYAIEDGFEDIWLDSFLDSSLTDNKK
jgi:hypothetical protein